MSALKTLLLACVIVGASPLVGWAEDIRFISKGQKYWWCGILTDEEIVVSGVDPSRNRVQVTRADGEAVWVSPDVLLTSADRMKLVLERVKTGIAIANELTKTPPKPAPTPAASLAPPAAHQLRLCNQARSGTAYVAIATFKESTWNVTVRGWYQVADGGCTLIDPVPGTAFLYSAYTANGLEWRGDGSKMLCVDPANAFSLAATDVCSAPHVKRDFTLVVNLNSARTITLSGK